jgi:hypothetical protein
MSNQGDRFKNKADSKNSPHALFIKQMSTEPKKERILAIFLLENSSCAFFPILNTYKR